MSRAGQNILQEQKDKTVLFWLGCYGGKHILRSRDVILRQSGLGMPMEKHVVLIVSLDNVCFEEFMLSFLTAISCADKSSVIHIRPV